MNGNITGKIFDSFKNRKFFDNSVLNKINTLTELGNNQLYESNSNITNVGNYFCLICLFIFYYIKIKNKITYPIISEI
jgi:hypothetical protein